jgi:hypothetical protein
MASVSEKKEGDTVVNSFDVADEVSGLIGEVASGDPFKAAVAAEGVFNVLSAAVIQPYEDFGEFIDFLISEARSRLSPTSNHRIDVFEDALIKLKKLRDK